MDGVARSFGKLVLLVVSPLLAAVTAPNCLAGGPACHSWCPLVDCCTLGAWHRTWHGPNALATPLRPYYIPRMSAGCCCHGCVGGCGGAIGECYLTEWPAEGEECLADCGPACLVLEPQGFERLGQIPNDVALGVGVAGPTPNRSGR